MTNRINAGERELQKLIEGKKISPSGADWVVVAADPFHDKPLSNLCGYPQEGVNGQSIVLKVPYQMQVSAPFGLSSGDTWDFLLTTYPWLNGTGGAPNTLVPYSLFGNYMQPLGTSPPSIDANSVSIYRGKTGNNLGPFEVAVPGNVESIGMSLEVSYTKGPHRLIAWGIEVYDTTAVIDRQGSCTVWRQNTNTTDKTSYQIGSDTGTGTPVIDQWGTMSGVLVRRPPKNIAEANKLAGTRSWKSEDGCYLVPTMNSNDIIIKQADDVQPILCQGDIDAGERQFLAFIPILSGPQLGTAVGTQQWRYPSHLWDFQPFNMSGAFFTGLKPSATFLVRTVFYVERFPTPDEPDIVLVTKPSATYDPMALEIYDHMLHNMPPGVPVDENGLGQWFYDGITSAVAWAFPKATQVIKSIMPNSTTPMTTAKRIPATKALKANPSSPPIRKAPQTKKTVKGLSVGEQLRLIREKKNRGQKISRAEQSFYDKHN